MQKKAIYFILGALLIVTGWIMFAGRNDVSDLGSRADDTRAEFKSAQKEQREQAASLDRAESAVRDSQNRATKIQDIERSDAEIIGESQSILKNVRNRNKKEN